MKARRISPGSSCDATASRRVHASASLVAPSTLTDDAYARRVPSNANPMPTEPRMSDFQAASMAAGVRDSPTSSAATMVAASMATHTRPRLSSSGTASRAPTNQSSNAQYRPRSWGDSQPSCLAWRRNAGEPATAMRPTSVTTSSVQPPKASSATMPPNAVMLVPPRATRASTAAGTSIAIAASAASPSATRPRVGQARRPKIAGPRNTMPRATSVVVIPAGSADRRSSWCPGSGACDGCRPSPRSRR